MFWLSLHAELPMVTVVPLDTNVGTAAEARNGAVKSSAVARQKTILLMFVCAASMIFLDSLDDNRALPLFTKKLGYGRGHTYLTTDPSKSERGCCNYRSTCGFCAVT